MPPSVECSTAGSQIQIAPRAKRGLIKYSQGRIMTTRLLHYDADATMAIPEPY